MIRALAITILAAICLMGCGRADESAADTDSLVIFSPHSDEIRQEFTAAFQAWYKRGTGRDVRVSWPDAGGGTEMLRRLADKFRAGRFDVDLVFGGGPIFDQLKALGMLQPCRLPADVLAAVPPRVAGQPLYDPEFNWYGAAISTFGIIYNKKMISDRGLPEVRDWESMADPRFFGIVGAGDASRSASVRKAYEIILQAYGYERGMAILMRIGANAREFYATASEIPRNCAQGFVAVGPCIEFYAFRQMRSEGGGNLGFIVPSGLTVVTPDPIGVLRGAPHPKVAEKFVEFAMRPEGQRLWVLPAGAPGGPQKYTLERLAALPSVYQEPGAKTIAERMNPFTVAPADFYSPAKENERQTVLADYLRVALMENHDPLKKAWKAVIDAGLPKERLDQLTRPLISEQEMLRLGREVWTPLIVSEDATAEQKADLKRQEEERARQRSDLTAAWSAEFRQRYEALAK
jgi:ABC-type Fe3+ transport system substrate-binding protein